MKSDSLWTALVVCGKCGRHSRAPKSGRRRNFMPSLGLSEAGQNCSSTWFLVTVPLKWVLLEAHKIEVASGGVLFQHTQGV